jgi:hypothetical protein
MKKITLFVTACISSFTAFSQISFDHDELINLMVPLTDQIYDGYTYLHNNSIDPTDSALLWHVIDDQKEQGWELNVCTAGECISNPTGEVEINVKPGSKIEFKVGFGFFDKAGEGQFKVVAKSKFNPSMSDTLFFQMKTTTGSLKKVVEKSFSVYPNPAKDFAVINFLNGGKETVKIYDILGNLVLSKEVTSGDKIDLTTLVNGVYVVRATNNSNYSTVLQKI